MKRAALCAAMLALVLGARPLSTPPVSAAPAAAASYAKAAPPETSPTPRPSATPAATPPGNPPPAASPTPPPADEPGRTDACGVLDILVDPVSWTQCVFNQALVFVLQAISTAIQGVVESSLNVISRTPPEHSYASPTVVALWGLMRSVANTALVLVAIWGGFNLMAREHLNHSYHETLELLPRLALGALLANTSLWWASFVIDLNNALCDAIGEASLPGWEAAGTVTQLLAEVLAILVYLVMSLLLVIQMLMRLALVDVLLVVAPLGLLCWVLPQTQGWARLWSGLYARTVLAQFVQVLALKLGNALYLELSSPDVLLLNVFLSIAVLALTLKIPGLLASRSGDGLGFARYVAYRQATQALVGGGAKGGAAAGGAP